MWEENQYFSLQNSVQPNQPTSSLLLPKCKAIAMAKAIHN